MKATAIRGLMLLSMVGLATACSGGEDRRAGENATEGQPTTPDNRPVEIAIAYPTGSEELLMERFGNQIIKKFPHFTIKYIPRMPEESSGGYASVLSSNQAIDISIMSLNNVGRYLKSIALESDISDLIKKYNYDLSYLAPSLVDIQRKVANGGIYGLPWTSGANVFLYNKDLFNKFGVPYPKDGMTWDEMYQLTRTMTRVDSGQQYTGLVMQFPAMVGLNQLSAPYFDEANKVRFLDDTFVKVFHNFARFLQIPGMEESKGTGLFLKDHTAAMMLATSGNVRLAAESVTNWDIARVPVFPEKPRIGFQASPEYFFITSRSKERDAAFQVLAFIASEEFQTWLGATYGLLPVAKDPSRIMQTFGSANPGLAGKNVQALMPLEFALTPVIHDFMSIGNNEMTLALNEVLTGIDVNTALRAAAERAAKSIEAELR